MYEAVEEVRCSSIISFAVNGCPSSSAIMPSEIVRKKPPLYLARDSAVRVMPGNQGLIPRRRKAFYLSLLSLFTFTEENIKIWVYTNEDSLLALSRSSTSWKKKRKKGIEQMYRNLRGRDGGWVWEREHAERKGIVTLLGLWLQMASELYRESSVDTWSLLKIVSAKLDSGIGVTAETYKQLVKYFLAHHRLRIRGIKGFCG